MDLKNFIADIPDFPKPGIIFKDITPLLKEHAALQESVKCMADNVKDLKITKVVGIEARGFIFGTAVALELGLGFIPVRKPGKLPAKTIRESYSLEYGSNTIEMHADALTSEDSVLLVDDLLATGGTMKAAVDLVERCGASVGGIAFVVELSFLNGRELLGNYPVSSLITY